ncbi:MAG: cytochrome b/b6 domain-containing protein [Myxococcales bacterium]|nr:cytochrome b/b6 domain-containing protein [Myxococcales bacterium]
MRRVYLHTVYERIWHWWQALAIMLLLVTGLEVHAPHTVELIGFRYAVFVHNVLGLALLLNAALGLFYQLSTGRIRSFLPEPRDFISLALRQVRYYLRGIFKDEPHPIAKTPMKRLNPLQRVTYLAILNVLLPLQIVTGVLIWGGQRWPSVVQALGGLGPLATIHTLAAWLFAAFVLMHVYLTTTAGHTWSAGVLGMITGWEEVENHQPKESQ